MQKKVGLYFSNDVVVYPLLFLLVLVVVFWIESQFNLNFNYLGIYPRKFEGLRGILFSSFIHGDRKHLFNNAVPLVVLSMALFYFYRNIRWKVMLYGLFFTGLFTWIIGRPSYHIGASGVIYMLTAFLLFRGIFSKQYQLTALSFSVIFIYGGLIWYVFPVEEKISWEGHLSGFLVGFIFAILFNKEMLPTSKYPWEKENYNAEDDLFMQQFDEDGNFIGTKPTEEIKEERSEEVIEKPKRKIIKYSYKENDTTKE